MLRTKKRIVMYIYTKEICHHHWPASLKIFLTY